jgi:2-dehydro-3-deoxyphosphogluconate aldolase/(4S)-4-hydroxy-2-oxoglutarate aldolase
MKQAIVASYEGGARLFELTNRGDNACWIFADLVKYFQKEHPDLILGVGSVLDPGTASLYISSGANFIVGSVLNSDVAKICNRRKVGYVPGCGTASEISAAEEMGVEFVKIFPGSAVGGPDFIKSILGPTPWTRILVTGGVEANRESLFSWFKAGANAVGMGSNLFKKDWISDGKYDQITSTIDGVIKWIREVRGQKTA